MGDQERYYFTDTASVSLEYAGEGEVDADDFTDDFDPADADTVVLDSKWTEFFDTEEFIQFDATVAQPIVQPYIHDGELRKFRKDETELKRAQAQIDNLPWTMGHPPEGRVTNANQIRGFWSDPHWSDGQVATLNVPANDTDALRFAVTNDEVSVGFGGTLDWIDDTTDEADAVQRDMAYDHVASVESGRCPPEKGCGLHADGDINTHGHAFIDAVRTQQTEEGNVTGTEQFDVGDFVSVVRDGERLHGRIVAIEDDTVMVQRYDATEDRFEADAITVDPSSLREWVGPHTDSCPGEECSCGCHEDDGDGEGESFTDAPDGIHTEDGDWYGIAPSETGDDEPKYELNNCNDVKDAYNLRNNGDFDVEVGTLVARIKRAADSHDCPDENRPWTDASVRLAQAIKRATDDTND